MSYHAGARLIDPHLLYQKAGVFGGAHIAVFGAGRTGHIVFPASLVVGNSGSVYAVDVLKDVLQEVDKRARLEGLHNVHTVWANVEQVGKTHIPENHLDAVFIVNVLCKTVDRHSVLAEAERLLRDKAKLVIVDWKKESNLPFAPQLDKRVDLRECAAWAEKNGLVLQEEFEAGAHHVGMVFFRVL